MENDSNKFVQLSSNTTMTYKDKVLVNDSITLYKYLIEVTDNDVTSGFNIYLENFVENLDKINKEEFVKKLIEELNEHSGLADIYIGNVSVLEDGTTTFSVNEEVYNSFYDVLTSSNDNTNENVANKNTQTQTQNYQNYQNSNYEDYSIPSEGAIKWDCDALAEATYDFMSGCSIFNESVTSIANQIRVADIPNDINGALLLNSANKILDVLKEKTDYLLAAYVAWGNSIKDFYIEEELQKLDFELTELQNSGTLDESKKENIEQRRKLLLEAKNSDKSFVELYYDVKNTTPVELTEEQIKEYYNTEEGTKELYNKYLEAYEDEAMAKSAYILFCEENGIMLTGDIKKIVDERNTLYNKLVSQGVYNETQIAQKMMSFDAKNNLSIEVLNQYKAELEQNKQEYIGSASNKKEEERLLHEWEVLNGMVQDDALLDKLKTSGKLSYSEQLDAQRAALEEAAKEGQSLEEITRNGFITLTTGGVLNVGVLALTFAQGLAGFGEGVYDATLTLGASDFIQNTGRWFDQTVGAFFRGEKVEVDTSPFKHTQDVNKMFKDYWSDYYQSEEYKKEFQEWYQKNSESYDPMGEFKLYVENKFKTEYGSSSTIYSKAVEEAIETGDYSNLDNIDLNTLRNAAKQFDTMDEVAISYVNDFFQNKIYDKDWYKEIEQYSLIKHDGVLGQVSLQIGRMAIPIALSLIPGGVSLGALGTLSIGATASSAALGISAFGSAAEGAYADGATYEQGVKYATLSAATEMLTEKLFSGVAGIGEGWLDNAVASGLDKIMYKISPKLSDNLIAQISKNLFVKGVGEGVEEVTSDLLDPIWQWMTYKSDYELKDVYKENVSLESLAQTFLISALTGIFMGGAEIGRNVNRFNTQLDSLRNLNKLFPNVDEYANAALAHMINMEGSTYSKVEVIDEIINTISSKMAEDARNAHPVPDLIDSLSNIKDGSSQIRIGGETITLSNEALYNILDSAKINNNKLEINLDGEVIGTDVLGDSSSGIIDISDSGSRVLSPETITEISFSDAKVQSRFMNSLFNSAEASLQQMLANPDIDLLSKEKINSLIEQMHNMKNNGNFSENIHDVANVINNMYNTRMNSVFTVLSDDMVVSNPVRVTDELYKYTAVYKDADGNYKTVTVYSNGNINYDSIFTDPATIESEITRAINANKDGDYVYIGKPTIESTGEVVFSEEIGVREKIEQIESGKDTQIKEDAEIIDVSESVEDTSVNTRENVDTVEETGVNTRENVNVTEETGVNTRENVNVTEETGVNTRENVNTVEETGVNTRESVDTVEDTSVNTRESVDTVEETGVNTRENVDTVEDTSVNTRENVDTVEETGVNTRESVDTVEDTSVNTRESVDTVEDTSVNTRENVDTVEDTSVNTRENVNATEETNTNTTGETLSAASVGAASMSGVMSGTRTTTTGSTTTGTTVNTTENVSTDTVGHRVNTKEQGTARGSVTETSTATESSTGTVSGISSYLKQILSEKISIIKSNVHEGYVIRGLSKSFIENRIYDINTISKGINKIGSKINADTNILTKAGHNMFITTSEFINQFAGRIEVIKDNVFNGKVVSGIAKMITFPYQTTIDGVRHTINFFGRTLGSDMNFDINNNITAAKNTVIESVKSKVDSTISEVTETSTATESSTGTVSGISSYLKQILSEKISIIKSNVHEGYVIRGLSKSFIENRIYDINTISKGINKIGSKINADTNILTKAGHNMFITTSEFINQFAGRIEVIKDNVFNGKVVSGIAKMITFPYQTTIDGVRHTINFFGRTLGSDMSFDINNNITAAKNTVIESIKSKVDNIISDVTEVGTTAEADASKETVSSKLGESIVESGVAVVEEVMSEEITPPAPTLDGSKSVDVNLQENVVKSGMEDYFTPDLSDNTVKQTEQKVSQDYKMDDLYDTPTLESQKKLDVSDNVANNQIEDVNADSSKNVDVNSQENVVKSGMEDYFAPDLSDNTVKQTEQKVSQDYKMDDLYDTPTLESQKKVDVSDNVANNQIEDVNADSSKNVDADLQEKVVKSGMEDYFAPDLSDNTVKQAEQKVSQDYKMDDLYDTPTLEPQKKVDVSDNVANNQTEDVNIDVNSEKIVPPSPTLEINSKNMTLEEAKNLIPDLELTESEYENVMSELTERGLSFDDYVDRPDIVGVDITGVNTSEELLYEIEKQYNKLIPSFKEEIHKWIEIRNSDYGAVHSSAINHGGVKSPFSHDIIEKLIELGIDNAGSDTSSNIGKATNARLKYDYRITINNNPTISLDEGVAFSSKLNELLSQNDISISAKIMWDADAIVLYPTKDQLLPVVKVLETMKNEQIVGKDVAAATRHFARDLKTLAAPIGKNPYYGISCSDGPARFDKRGTSVKGHRGSIAAKEFGMSSTFGNYVNDQILNPVYSELYQKYNGDTSLITPDEMYDLAIKRHNLYSTGSAEVTLPIWERPYNKMHYHKDNVIDLNSKVSEGGNVDEIIPPSPTLDSSKNVDVNLQENVVKSGMEDYFTPDLSDNTVKQTEQKVSQDYKMDDLYDTPTLESQKKLDVSDNVANNQTEDVNIGDDSAKIVPPAPNLNKTGESTIMEMVQENLDAKVLTNGNEWSVIEELGERINKNSNLYRKIENEYLEFDSLVKDANRRFTDIIESLDSDSVVRENITNQAENTLNDVREKIDKIYNWNFHDSFDYETREMLETAKTDMLNRYGTLEDLIQKISAKTEMGVNIESPAIKSDSDLAKVLLNSDPVVSKFGDWSKNINKSGEDINLDTDSAKIIPPEPTTTLETKVEADTAWTETDRTNFLREYYSSEIELASDTNALKDMLTKETGAESPYLKASDDVIRGMIDAQASGLDLNVTKEIQALLDATKRLKPGEVILNRKGVLDGEAPVVISGEHVMYVPGYGFTDIVKQVQTGLDSGIFNKEIAHSMLSLLNENGIKSTKSIEGLKTLLKESIIDEFYASEKRLASDTNALKDALSNPNFSDDVIHRMAYVLDGLDLNATKEVQRLIDATKGLKPGEVILNRKGVLDGETPVVISKKIASKYGNIVEQAQTGMDSGLFTKECAQQIFELLNEQGIKSTESIENLKTKIVESYLKDGSEVSSAMVERLTNITKRLKPGEVILNMSSVLRVLDGEAPVVIPNEMTAKYGDIVRQTQNALDSGVFNEESAQQIFELLNEKGIKSTESIERLKFKVKHNLNTTLLEINSDVFSDGQAEIPIEESHFKRMETIVESIETKLKPRLEDELSKLEEDYESQRRLLELEKSEKIKELKETTKNTLSDYDIEMDIDAKYKYNDKFEALEQGYKDTIDRLNKEYESGIQKIFTKEMSEVRIGETKAIIESVSPTVKEVDAIIGFTEKEIMDIKPGEDVGYSGRSKVELLDTLEKLKTKRIEAERAARDLASKESKIDPIDFSEGDKYDGSERYILGRNRAPLSAEIIERKVKDMGISFYEELWDNVPNLAEAFGISIDQMQFELDKKIRDFVEKGYVGIRKGVKSLPDILDSGYIKNQFETKTSSATKGGPPVKIEDKHRDRSRVESRVFGIEYDTPYVDRPIYGMMFPTDADVAKLKTYIKTGPGWWYGSGEEKCVIILNKEAIRKTTSITMGDSFGVRRAATLDNPVYSGGITESIISRFKSLEEFRNADLTKIFNNADRNYLECQIYGQASHAMTPEVVKEVIFMELPSESLIEKLEKANIPWRVL